MSAAPIDAAALAAQLEQELGCRMTFACRDLASDARLGHRADERVPTASVIKLPILVHIAMAAASGAIDWGEQLVLTEAVKVPGSGILKELSAGVALSVRDLCALMTALSDNTATNMLIDRFGIDAVNARLDGLGLRDTRLLRRAFTPDTPSSRPFGLGVSTANETVELLARIARGGIGDGDAAEVTLALLAMQQDRAAFPRLLPAGWQYAGKTGSNAGLRVDAGILTGPDGRQLALAAFCTGLPPEDWSVDNPGLLAMARLAQRLVER